MVFIKEFQTSLDRYKGLMLFWVVSTLVVLASSIAINHHHLSLATVFLFIGSLLLMINSAYCAYVIIKHFR